MSSALSDLASRLRQLLDEALAADRTPQIILDLDGTLFDNVPRTKRILLDQARHIFGEDADVTKAISEMPEDTFEYDPTDTLRKHGVEDEATLERLHEAWASEFFGSDYLDFDAPLKGAVTAARTWWEDGAELDYLTGRHVPDMFLGTCRSLHHAGFPIGTIRTQLLMKPAYEMSDVGFKIDAVEAVRRKGPIALVVDNDPRVLNPLSEVAPEAISVMVKTLHPKDAPPLHEGIPVVGDFRALLV